MLSLLVWPKVITSSGFYHTQFGDPIITFILPKTGFGDQKISTRDPEMGRDSPVEKYCFTPRKI
jgi:hypothetical protein